jgi:Isopropylmalate/homocitrate/citramalate synthases
MKERRFIVDTTLRDGEQSPGLALSVAQKVAVADVLDELGIYQIEAAIPAMGKLEQDAVCAIMEHRKTAKISTWNRMVPGDIKKSLYCKPDIIHISVPVSYIHIYTKLQKNKNWVQKNLAACSMLALEQGYEVTVGFEDASRADITFMNTLAEELLSLGVKRVRVADTVGVMTPSRVSQCVKSLIDNTGIEIEIHAHNDLGMAVANTVAGAKAGALFMDTTVMGLGERTGNCDFQKFVFAASGLYKLDIERIKAIEAEQRIAAIISDGV